MAKESDDETKDAIETTATEVSIDDYSVQLVKTILSETVELLDKEDRKLGRDFFDVTLINLLTSLVATIVYRHLPTSETLKKLSDKDKQAHYFAHKVEIQAAIALGFQTAIKTFNGVDADYFCTVAPVPDPAPGSLPC